MHRKRKKTLRWFTAACSAAALAVTAALMASPANAVHDNGLFELDKDATNNQQAVKIGTLGSNINATATSITICQTSSTNPSGLPITIQIDAEQMTVSVVANASGGGCTGASKRTYTVARHANGTTAAAHSGGEDVTQLVSSSNAGDDWDQVYNEVTSDPDTKCTDLGAVECAFVHDPENHTIFTTGGSKDDLDIPSWRYTDGSVPDADEILDAFAAKYTDTNDDQILYFGADRLAVNGSKDFGFWFFRNPVGLNTDGTFSGEHSGTEAEPGDILILGTFTQGGAATNIRVFRWVGTGGNATSNGTVQGPDAAFADCVPGGNNDDGCGTVNNTTIPVPWSYQAKGETALKEIPSGGFLEGGINLTAIGLEGCFSSFVAETRSSPSVDAQLKDFVLGNFEACGSSLATTPADDSGAALTDTNDNDVPDAQLGTGSDGVDVTDSAQLDVNGTSSWSGTLDFYLCGPSVTVCDTDGVPVGSVPVDQDTTMPVTSASANLTAAGSYCWLGVFTSDTTGVPDATDDTATECFEVLPVQPDLDTQAVDANGDPLTGDVSFGSAVYDLASLSGTANQPGDNGGNTTYPSINATNGDPAGGTITFTLYGPDGSSTDCNTVATGTGSNPETGVAVSGDDDYQSSGFTPDQPGDFHWAASYSGDSPNTLDADHNTACDDTDEDVTVQQLQPTMDTAQDFVPNDSATITVESGAGDLDGDVVFELFVDNTTCTGTADYTSSSLAVSATDDPNSPTISDTVSSDNATAYDTDGTTFSWRVSFTSNNSAHKDVTSACNNENSSINIDNGSQANTP
jgi:hypothetical protein